MTQEAQVDVLVREAVDGTVGFFSAHIPEETYDLSEDNWGLFRQKFQEQVGVCDNCGIYVSTSPQQIGVYWTRAQMAIVFDVIVGEHYEEGSVVEQTHVALMRVCPSCADELTGDTTNSV